MIRFDLDQVRTAIQQNGHLESQTIDTQEGETRQARRAAQPRLVSRHNN